MGAVAQPTVVYGHIGSNVPRLTMPLDSLGQIDRFLCRLYTLESTCELIIPVNCSFLPTCHLPIIRLVSWKTLGFLQKTHSDTRIVITTLGHLLESDTFSF